MDNENAKNAIWNKKRIFIAFFLIILFGIGVYFYKTEILGEKISFFTRKASEKPSESSKSVRGANVKEVPSIDIQKVLKEKIEELKLEASKIDVAEIASSSPQIQKLIKDIGSFRDYPANQAKEICQKICGNL
ncbi:MAG: hypothetical protein AAB583_03320 [Patescibacteria group bacterium]